MQVRQQKIPGSTLLRLTESVLIVAGIVMLAWCGWIVADAMWSQREARQALDRSLPLPPRPSGWSASPATAPPSMRHGTPSVGTAIGDIQIPRVQLSAVVLHGSDTKTLRRGPGHLENTPLPGDPGNVVIAGHRDTFFRELRDVHAGDDIFLTASRGRIHYQVASTRVVHADDLSVIRPTEEETLTLITCFPFWVLGPAPDRFVVRAIRVTDQPTASSDAPLPRPASAPPVAKPFRAAVAAPTTRPHNEPITRPQREPTTRPHQEDVADDGIAVRRTIERFETTYNARIASHGESQPGGPLKLTPCDVTVDSVSAVATCTASSPSDGDTRPLWTLTLERVDAGWAIRAIRTN